MAIKVKLRKKPISGNRESLYLDFYPPIPHPDTGELTRRQFLGMYLYLKPKSSIDKQHNKETEEIAKHVRQKKESELNKPEIYSGYEKDQLRIKEQGEKSFIDYFKSLADKRKASNHDNWVSAYHYLLMFTGGSLKFVDLSESFCNDFKEFLLTTRSKRTEKLSLSQNSAVSYFNKLKATLKQAYKDGLLPYDLNVRVEAIETKPILKQTLTMEELNQLAKVPCCYPVLRRAALFSALTGMPFKEMQNLTWRDIEESETFGIRFKIIRQKTERPYIGNISKQAYNLLGERSDPEFRVFIGLNNKDRYNNFHIWLAQARISKEITFHDLRHTYGSLQIELGTDIYTLQGNMGHATPRQSMHYGKISDVRKREAAEIIQLKNL